MSDATDLPLRAENNPKFYSRFKWLGLGAFAFMLYCLYDGLYSWPLIEKRCQSVMRLAEEVLPAEKVRELDRSALYGDAVRYQFLRKEFSDSPELLAAWRERARDSVWSASLPEQITTDTDQERASALIGLARELLPHEKMEKIDHAATRNIKQRYLLYRQEVIENEELREAWVARSELEGSSSSLPAKMYTQVDLPSQYGMAVISLLVSIWFWFTVYRTNGRWFELGEAGITSRWGESFSLDKVTVIDKKQWRDKGIAKVKYTGEKGAVRTFVVDNYKYDKPTTDRILLEIERAAGADKIINGPPEEDPRVEASPVEQPAEA